MRSIAIDALDLTARLTGDFMHFAYLGLVEDVIAVITDEVSLDSLTSKQVYSCIANVVELLFG